MLLGLLLLHLNAASAMTVSNPPMRKVPSDGFVREAEKKHARIAMLALPTLAAIAAVDPDPVTYLSRQPVDVQLAFFSAAGVIESFASLPRLAPGFALKDGIVPGNFFGLPAPGAYADAAEDLVGRAAMVVAAGVLLRGVL